MDYFDFDSVKAEKARAMRRYNLLQSVAKVFRLIELILAVVFLAWTSARVPFAVRISSEFFAKVGGVIASPLFVFLLCNVIIATLFAKSGWFSAENLGASNADTELYQEIVKNSENRQTPFVEDDAAHSTDEIVYQDKEIISEVSTMDLERERNSDLDLDSDSDKDVDHRRAYRRSKSEKFVRESEEKGKKELRRSETDKIGKLERRGEELHPQEELSNEEFQQKIEDFISKQLQFRREESLAIVLRSQA
ncbi:hypothetical protein SLE2022_360810 [Rubroshorea leprosula]